MKNLKLKILDNILDYIYYYFIVYHPFEWLIRRLIPRQELKTNNKNYLNQIVDKNVHGLWIGDELSLMELLTIKSFILNGYNFNLWVYEPIKTELPKGCICHDANKIITKDKVFKYKHPSQFGVGVGSYAGFSDIFRYKLLHDVGGWWVDMDVTCLKPFDVDAPYFFSGHISLPLVGNIMKAPKGSKLMKKCYEQATIEVNEENRDWHLPIKILVDNVFDFKLQKYIVQGISNNDISFFIKKIIYLNVNLPNNWFFIHWCNEIWRTNKISKNNFIHSSIYGNLLTKYGLVPKLDEKQISDKDRKLKIKLISNKFFKRG